MVFGDIQCFCSILHTAITKTLIYVYSAPNPTLSLLLLFQMNTCYSNNHMPGDTTHRKPTTNCDGISLLFPTIYWFVVRLPKRCETVRAWLLCSLLILVIAMTASVVFFSTRCLDFFWKNHPHEERSTNFRSKIHFKRASAPSTPTINTIIRVTELNHKIKKWNWNTEIGN